MAVDKTSSIFKVYKVYILKTASTGSGEFFYELEQFFFNLNCTIPQVIIHDIGYILHPSKEHFQSVYSLFPLSHKVLQSVLFSPSRHTTSK